MRLYLLLPFALFLLSACNDPDDEITNGPPVIHDIQTDITHWHTHYVSSIDDIEARISFSVQTLVTDSGGLQDLAQVYVHNESVSERRWYLVGGPENEPWYTNYSFGLGLFQYPSFDPDHLDDITLNGWELVVEDFQGNEVREPFDFLLPDGQPADDGVRVYSDDFATPGINDVPALDAMSIADNALSLSRDDGTSSFNITFRSTDHRASNYVIYFYSALPERNYLGYANKISSPSIASTSISANVTTNLALPWEEIVFVRSNIAASAVGSISISLMNEGIALEYLPTVEWMSYIGISELVDLPTEDE